jgi:hypothetical protein
MPDTDFKLETKYTITISIGITGVTGNKMTSMKQWSFTTTTAKKP